jgi:putative FmdB family regulatory protein
MPLYDYDCAACGRRFEVVHGVHVEGPTTCPLCGKGPVRKAISAPAVHYRGSGWAKKERHAAISGRAKSSADGGSSADGNASTSAGDSSTDGAAKSDERTKSGGASGGRESGGRDSKDDARSKDGGRSKGDSRSGTGETTDTKPASDGAAGKPASAPSGSGSSKPND